MASHPSFIRPNGFIAVCLAFIVALSCSNIARADDGVVRLKSNADVSTTIDRLASALKTKGITIFARVDHAAGAKAAGLELRPSQLLIFGNPKLGTPLMQSNALIGLDLPMKMLAWEDADGTTYLSYTAPAELLARYDISGRDEVFAKMATALGRFAQLAVTGEAPAAAPAASPSPETAR